jgi:hypothetical protein
MISVPMMDSILISFALLYFVPPSLFHTTGFVLYPDPQESVTFAEVSDPGPGQYPKVDVNINRNHKKGVIS